MRRRALAVLTVFCLLAPVSAAAADCPRTSLGDVEDEVMCVVCGTPLGLATEAPQANRERALIERLVAQCQSKDQVKDRLVAEYGDRVLATPESGGFDLAAYVVPGLGILLATGAVGGAAVQWRRTRRRETGSAGQTEDPSSAAADRLQADLDRCEP